MSGRQAREFLTARPPPRVICERKTRLVALSRTPRPWPMMLDHRQYQEVRLFRVKPARVRRTRCRSTQTSLPRIWPLASGQKPKRSSPLQPPWMPVWSWMPVTDQMEMRVWTLIPVPCMN